MDHIFETARRETDVVICETELIVFRRSTIHGTGGHARKSIAAGTTVIEYMGERITKAESLARCEANNSCIFALNDVSDLDGNVPWNPARLLNHSCAANCEARLGDNRVWIVARRDIAAGEELTFNYGYDLEDYREHPCSCGDPECVGFIVAEDFFEHVRTQNALCKVAAPGPSFACRQAPSSVCIRPNTPTSTND